MTSSGWLKLLIMVNGYTCRESNPYFQFCFPFHMRSTLSFCRSTSTTVDYSLGAIIADLCCHLTYHLSGHWHTVYAMVFSNYK